MRTRMSRRSFLMTSVAAIGVAALSACGATPTATPIPPAPTNTPVPPTVAPAAPAATKPPAPTAVPPTATKAPAPTAPPAAAASSGTLVGGFDVGPGGHAQSWPYHNTAGNQWLPKIWSPLVSWNRECVDLAPQLAVKWTMSPDGKTWVFNLRPNVKWHDGQPFTADDVKFSYELALNPKFETVFGLAPLNNMIAGAPEYIKGAAKEVTGIKVIDPLTVQFSLNTPNGRLPFYMFQQYVLPKHILGTQDAAALAKSTWFLTNPVGTGPWKVANYVKDQYQDTVPNEYYWHGKPKLAHLINRYFTDETAAHIALEKGEIQFTYVGADVAIRLKGTPGYQVFEGPSTVANYVQFNLRDKRLQDLRVRQAFWYAIDRKTIIKEVWKDTVYLRNATPCQVLPSEPPDLIPYEYNPDKARQLLKDANWNPNDNLEMWTYYASQQHKDAMQAMQAYLEQVGMKITPKVIDTPSYNAQFYTGEGWQLSYRGGGNMRGYLAPDTQPKDKKSWGGLDDPTVNTLVDATETALTQEDYVKTIYDLAKVDNANVYTACMWLGIRFGAASSKVKNFYWYPAGGGGPFEDHSELWEIAP